MSVEKKSYKPGQRVPKSGHSLITNLQGKIKVDALMPLDELYTFDNREDVTPFLSRYAFLIDPLLDTHRHIQEIFAGGFSSIHLHHVRDPEEGAEALSITIDTDLTEDRCDTLLQSFYKQFWLKLPPEQRTLMNIMALPQYEL